MKSLLNIAVVAILLTFLSSCSSAIEVVDSWKNDNFSTLDDQKILVIYKTENMITKQRFEQDVVKELQNMGINAKESFKAFPELIHKQVRDEKELEEIVAKIKNAGYHGVILTVLKDQSTETQTTTTGGYTTAGGYYGGYYGYGFGGYYGSVYGYPWGYGYSTGVYVPKETTTTTVDVYLFETLFYNIDLETKDELVGVLSVKLTDPESYSQVAKKYVKDIAKVFEDQVKD